MHPISYPSSRVSQLDANILDSELFSLLKDQLSSIFQLHDNNDNSFFGKFSFNKHPETYSLLLNLLIFRLTVWKSGSSYGDALQNLKLSDAKTGKIIGFNKKSLLLAFLVGTYLYKRLETKLYQIDESESSEETDSFLSKLKNKIINNRTEILTKCDNTFKIINLVNFTMFLVSGRYPSVIRRVLRITETPVISDLLKFNGSNVNYEFQNRQLVWNVMTEFLVFLLPLLQLKKIRKFTRKIISKTTNPNPKDSTNSIDVDSKLITRFSNLPVSECAICHYNNEKASQSGGRVFTTAGPVTNACITNCGHVFCYVCIATQFNVKKTSGEDVLCLRCNSKLEWFQEFEADEKSIDEDAITIRPEIDDQQEEEDEDETEEIVNEKIENSDGEYESQNDEDDVEEVHPLEKVSTTRLDRKLSHRSSIFDEDVQDNEESEDEFSDEEEMDADEAML
ncbi:PEX2 [Candida pseudojiufengensis]|uniref:PEX2 n=1 Tax=Candida pseudojiufengensis TaxID=497109 RepID=UPI002224F6E9|nr:PEX2 [Candida pseudojiufengensis]KAI5963265.1 PEX2 [Candida pseudojiufengensis]